MIESEVFGGFVLRFFSFDTQAKYYSKFCEAQQFFSQALIERVSKEWGQTFDTIIDLGCGSGELIRELVSHQIRFGFYTGCDISQAMLDCFYWKESKSTKSAQIRLIMQDFDSFLLQLPKADLYLSNSSLQWSQDIAHTFKLLADCGGRVALCVITSETFASLHSFLHTISPLQDVKNVQESFFDCFEGTSQILQKDLIFSHSRDLLNHLRRSGVMGGGVLDFKRAKSLLSYKGRLEYQGVILIGQSKKFLKEKK